MRDEADEYAYGKSMTDAFARVYTTQVTMVCFRIVSGYYMCINEGGVQELVRSRNGRKRRRVVEDDGLQREEGLSERKTYRNV
jgi:hypothetical protein